MTKNNIQKIVLVLCMTQSGFIMLQLPTINSSYIQSSWLSSTTDK